MFIIGTVQGDLHDIGKNLVRMVGEGNGWKGGDLGVDVSAVPGSGRILIVEDEAVIQLMATRMLEHLGYDVVTTSDGQEGAEYYEQHGSEIDLVIIDMIMPRMNGRDCFIRMKAMNPGVKAILSTGYGLDSAVRELLGDGMIGYVQKPYVVGQLSEAVAKALNATPVRAGRALEGA